MALEYIRGSISEVAIKPRGGVHVIRLRRFLVMAAGLPEASKLIIINRMVLFPCHDVCTPYLDTFLGRVSSPWPACPSLFDSK